MAEAFEEPPEDRSAEEALTKANGACQNYEEGAESKGFKASVYASHAAYLDARWIPLREALVDLDTFFQLGRDDDGSFVNTPEAYDAKTVLGFRADVVIRTECALVEELLEQRKGK